VIDDRTTAYVIAAQPMFEDLRQVAAQLAGLLLLAATASKESTPDHPMLAASKQVLKQADDGVKRVADLVSERARPHYDSLVNANASLGIALACAGAWPLDVDAVIVPLRASYDHLQAASRALPGFPIIEMDQGCCALSKSANVF
jgi:hypothetical protein